MGGFSICLSSCSMQSLCKFGSVDQARAVGLRMSSTVADDFAWREWRMTVEHGKIEGDISLDYELTLHGMVTGNVTIVSGGALVLHGMCCQNLIVQKGAKAYLHGTVGGNALNRGGTLEVYGTVGGYVHTTENGNTFIDQYALVIKGSR
jgi:cytoskeletal protein CcmA (bactofilin family)